MDGHAVWPWAALILLGAFHGINPGMGWLFAVALGMQERSRTAVWRSLVPLGLGHGLAIGAAILTAVLVGVVLPLGTLRWPVAVILVSLGIYRFFRHRHPRAGGMRVGFGGLALWSFLMATAHGAGLMVLPLFVALAADGSAAHSHHAAMGNAFHQPLAGLAATLVHGAAYLLVTALAAWAVYDKLGIGLLRKTWVNLDLVWAAALIVTGSLTLLI